MPTLRRNPTAQVVNVDDYFFLVDCAEGTQMQMRRFEIGMQKIENIFISHLHGDHYLGLPGYLQTLHLLGRSKKMTIHGPEALQRLIMDHFTITNSTPRFPIEFVTVAHEHKLIFENKLVEVWSIPLKHKIPTTGFLFRQKPKLRNIITSMLKEYRIPVYWIQRIKEGEDYVRENGEVIPNRELTLPPAALKSYAFCSDTAYNESIIPIIQGVDLLYHEASFLENLRDRAIETLHSTAADAGKIATAANVKKLAIGHFSARYKEVDELVSQAKELFNNVVATEDGLVLEV
ncbi:MAG: ribonuclease Z [Bacteroidota bacterium]